ncbi:Chalcone-flavanone isomerase family protein [Rhynchospora pubera]|uniref:Chalcone-flavanone isomerase family protein n=1 Tax=Rhynchospora pubera TaxID=906938 RepID=A0AAV8GAN9_9POAL|nr:Chalcone-flavanone isomerase family protein [Rhynchospora pubera]
METPSSLRKASQSSGMNYKIKQEGNKADRTALIDITNDSPIVGLATGSGFVKSPIKLNLTPGSGEAILRSQVKTLLQKIEEKEVGPKIPSLPHRLPPSRSGIPGFARSPMQMLAPTPMNTPQIPQIPEDLEHGFLHPPPQIMSPVVQHDEPLGLCVLNRALLFDSPDKNDVSSGSTRSTITSVAYQESVSSNGCFTISSDRNLSIWSIQRNASTNKEKEIESESDVGELCKGFRDMAVAGGKFEGRKHTRFVYNSDGEMERDGNTPGKNEVSSGSTGSTITSVAYQESVSSNGCFTISSNRNSSIWSIQGNASTNKEEEIESESDVKEFRDMAVARGKFEGKHTRFVYNSDGEMEREECNENQAAMSPGVVVLKGLPVPEGKLLRFQEEEGED